MTDCLETIAADVLRLARAQGVKIAAAESCTGGLLMAALTAIPGSSDVVERGFVTYSNEAKVEMLGVPKHLIDEHGAVSEPVAAAMADGALRNSHASLALSVTGVAGPGPGGTKPEGRVCFGLARSGAATHAITVEFGALGRENVRAASVQHALGMMQDIL